MWATLYSIYPFDLNMKLEVGADRFFEERSCFPETFMIEYLIVCLTDLDVVTPEERQDPR